jgi:hypothetical protein
MAGVRLSSRQGFKVGQYALQTCGIFGDNGLELLPRRFACPRLRKYRRRVGDGVDLVFELVGDGAIEFA